MSIQLKSPINSEYRRIIRRVEEFSKYIDKNPQIMDGIPVVKGTRIPVYVIIEMLSGGYSFLRIQKEYPALSFEAIHAAVHFASCLTAIN